MDTYEIVIGCLIFGYIILLYLTKKQAKTIKDQEQTINILNEIYKNIKQTCKCCEMLHEDEIVSYINRINADEELINILRKRLDEVDRW